MVCMGFEVERLKAKGSTFFFEALGHGLSSRESCQKVQGVGGMAWQEDLVGTPLMFLTFDSSSLPSASQHELVSLTLKR